MPESEAQRRANLKYRKTTKQLVLQFPPNDPMWEWLEAHKPKASYVKELIRRDMERPD